MLALVAVIVLFIRLKSVEIISCRLEIIIVVISFIHAVKSHLQSDPQSVKFRPVAVTVLL